MKEQDSKKQTTVRPGFLILGVLSIILMVVWLFILKPKPDTKVKTRPVKKEKTAINVNKSKDQDKAIIQNSISKQIKVSTSRDPFLPPIFYYTKQKGDQRPNITPLKEKPDLFPDFDKPKTDLEELIKPTWKGMIGTANNRVVIIEYKNKTYLLKKGDQIPGTKYRVNEILTDSIIITYPNGKISLSKK